KTASTNTTNPKANRGTMDIRGSADTSRQPINRFMTTANRIVFYTDIRDQNKPAGKRAKHCTDGIGSVRATDAAPDPVETLSKQSRYQGKRHAQKHRGHEHHERRQKYLQVEKHGKRIAKALQQANKNQG